MKLNRTLALSLVAALSISLLSGCGGTSGKPADDSKPSPDASETSSYDGKPVELVVQCHDPENSIAGAYLKDWEGMVTKASDNNITFVNYFGGSLVSAPEAADAVKNGVADMCWAPATIFSGQFPISEFLSLPLTGINCGRMGSKTFMSMYEAIPELQKEYEDYYLVQVSQCTTMPISLTDKKCETAADFKGLRIRVSGSTASLWATAVGMSPMTVATPETYESLEKNVIEGCINDWHNIIAFNLGDVIKNVMTLELVGAPMFVIINRQTYDGMDPVLQQVIDSYSGSYASDMAGYYWDATRAACLDYLEDKGVDVYAPSDELLASFTSDSVKQQVHNAYVEYLNGFNLDGQKIYDAAMAEVEQYAPDYTDPWGDGCPTCEHSESGFRVNSWPTLAEYKG